MTERRIKSTDRIYERDSSVREFEANVLSVKEENGEYKVILDRTAFFPTGGGQSCDLGTLGGCRVKVVHIEDGEIIHVISSPLTVGQTVIGALDYGDRLEKMQSHTAEHILSAVLHKKYGFANVGFHLGSADTTCDFDGYLAPEELNGAEDEVNRIIRENHMVYAEFPTEGELKSLEYRSKLDLSEDVRIVTIGEDGSVDRCACCAPHVTHTGMIGLFKIVDSYRYKGGMRVHILTGQAALGKVRADGDAIRALSALLSAKPIGGEVVSAVGRLLESEKVLKGALSESNGRINSLICAALPENETAVIFDDRSDASVLRALCLSALCRVKTAAVFGGSDGEYRFVISGELASELFASLKSALDLRGGGKDVICGTVFASRKELENAL